MLLKAVAESLLRVLCHHTTTIDDNARAIKGKEPEECEGRKVEVMPYLHKVSHSIKKVAV